MYYNKCEFCGANLDPGEKCDCIEQRARKIRKREAANKLMKELEDSEWIQEKLKICC